MTKEEHYRKLEHMYNSSPMNKYYSPTMRVSEGCAEVCLKVRQDFFHPAGAINGSVYFKALDDAAFYAVNSLVQDVFVLTVSFNVYLTRPVSEGEIKATGRVVHRSRNLFVADSELIHSGGKQVARGSGTFMRSTIPLSTKLGYE
ncbi:PaaI family thioesterase [Chloroflexota bacterium]